MGCGNRVLTSAEMPRHSSQNHKLSDHTSVHASASCRAKLEEAEKKLEKAKEKMALLKGVGQVSDVS
eukprot:4165369-Amphidinium_carterae.1